jgi:hypothetical protein
VPGAGGVFWAAVPGALHWGGAASTPSPHPLTPSPPPPATAQSKYALEESSETPITLHSDLVRLTKLAKIGQQALGDSVRTCCGGATNNPFALYTAGIEDTINAAVVNVSAIAAAVVATDHDVGLTAATQTLSGRLMNNGGVKDCKVRAARGVGGCPTLAGRGAARGRGRRRACCPPPPPPVPPRRLPHHAPLPFPACLHSPPPKGTYEGLLTGDRRDITTDALGGFEVPNPALALYTFSPAINGSACRDAITNVPVRFPMSLYVPPVASTVINPIALLTVPAASDPFVTKLYNGKPTDGRAPAFLWTQAYKLFDYDADDLGVDFLRYIGDALTLGKPAAAAISGTSTQLMAVYASALGLLQPLLGPETSVNDLSGAIVKATYDAVNTTWAATGDGSGALTSPGSLSELYSKVYTGMSPSARTLTVMGAPPRRTAEELKPLFDAVAKVGAGAAGVGAAGRDDGRPVPCAACRGGGRRSSDSHTRS